jgi:hydrogenase 3 maturation protease
MPLNDGLNDLQQLIFKSDPHTILFVGIGNVLRKDDGAGVYISRKIRETKRVFVLTVEVSIENYIGKINIINPDILILIDCMDFNQPPGSCRIIPLDNIADQTFNTHNISLARLGDFFRMQVCVLGIQPQCIDFGEHLSYPVKKSADMIVRSINRDNFKIKFTPIYASDP